MASIHPFHDARLGKSYEPECPCEATEFDCLGGDACPYNLHVEPTPAPEPRPLVGPMVRAVLAFACILAVAIIAASFIARSTS